MKIVVNYEEASKNRDMSALTCFKPNNKYTYDIVVGADGYEADEIFKIVSEQGYLKKHDSALLDKVAEKIKTEMIEDYPPNINGVKAPTPFAHFSYNGVCKILNKVIEDLKAEVSK